MRTFWGNKEVLQIFFTVPFIRENAIWSFWLRTIGNPAFRNFVTSQKADFKHLTESRLILLVIIL